jgi:hypothetical protein
MRRIPNSQISILAAKIDKAIDFAAVCGLSGSGEDFMRMEPDEIEYHILNTVVEKNGCRQKDCYKDLIGKPHSESFLWERVQILVKEGYLERVIVGPGHVRLSPTTKAKRLISGANNNIRGRK